MNIFTRLKYRISTLYAMVKLSRSPENLEFVGLLGDNSDPLLKDAVEQGNVRNPFEEYPELETQWLENYKPGAWNLDKLTLLESDSLGKLYADHMIARNLDPNRYDDIIAKNKFHWLRLRIQKTHEIWHVISGFDTDKAGEVGSQGIYFAQYVNGQSALILGGGIMKTIMKENYDITDKFIDAFIKGYILGKSAKPLLPVKWEQYWDEPIEDVRRMLNVDLIKYEKVQELIKI